MKQSCIPKISTKMTLRDILEGHPPVKYCQERTNFADEPDGIFTGSCEWTGTELLPLDGDCYSLDVEIYRYEWEEDGSLTYWVWSNWIT